MSDKNLHYKLDFKIKKASGNLTFKDFRRRYYWTGSNRWNVPAVDIIVNNLFENNNVSSIVPKDINIAQTAVEAGVTLNKDEINDFTFFVNVGRQAWYENLYDASGRPRNRYITNSSRERYEAIVAYLVTRTSQFQDYEAQFQTWLAKRPGLQEVWDELYEDKPTLIDFAKASNNHEFRTKLENSRPRVLKIGTLVQLKDKFINNRNKDPFYWNQDYSKSPRLGMIAGFNENSAFGYGSRLLRIMWIANSEETTLMERELKILSE